MERYGAPGAAGLVMDVRTGEVVAAVSRPGADPAIAEEALDPERIDKVAAGTFELGSISEAHHRCVGAGDGQVAG
jgi:cell division protein FtsI (penicillin-binding protein 3)